MPLTPLLPETATPGEPDTPHAFYKTAPGWPGLTLTTTRQNIPFGLTVFEQPGRYDTMPVVFDVARSQVLNTDGRVFHLRLSFEIEADVPTTAQAIAYANTEHGAGIGSVLDLLNPVSGRAYALAMSDPEVRVAAHVGGSLGEIVKDDIRVHYGATSLVRSYPLFGGATMQVNGIDLGLYLPDSSAAEVRVTSASLMIAVVSSDAVAPGAA